MTDYMFIKLLKDKKSFYWSRLGHLVGFLRTLHFNFPTVLPDEKDDAGDDHQHAERLSAAHTDQVVAPQKIVRVPEKFDEETESAIAHQVEG